MAKRKSAGLPGPGPVHLDGGLPSTPVQQLRSLALEHGLSDFLRSDAELKALEAAAPAAAIAQRPARPFAVGDVVKLKSGGHRMVVEELRCASQIHVYWSERGTLEGIDIHERCLRLCVDGEGNDDWFDRDIPF